jgi:phenylacetate-CoA ligase
MTIRHLLDHSYGWLLRNILLPAGDAALGHALMCRLRFLEAAQWWSAAQIRQYRDARIQSLFAALAEVPFYRDLLAQSGLCPGDIRTASDLGRIPPVTKQMLRANYPDRTTRFTGQTTYEASTSGSTGQNFRVREDRRTAGWYRASFFLALEWAGWRLGETHLQTGMTLDRTYERRLKDLFLRCFYFSAYDLGDDALDRALEVLDRKRIEHLWGYPGSLYCLARRAHSLGFSRQLRSLVTWGDHLQASQRACMESAFKARVFDTYGCGEGIQVAAQCGRGQTYHLHSLHVIVDYVDDAGNPVVAGTPGNLLLTRLHAGPMPLIRYQVGDVATSGRGKLCPCGRAWEILESIQGRSADVIVTPAGNRLIVHFFTGILEHFREIDQFQAVQEKPDTITLRILPTAAWSGQSESAIVAALQEKGADLDVRIERVKEIPLTPGGKRRFVISSLQS